MRPGRCFADNGTQYHTWRGKSAFRKILEDRGIRHVLARPRHPQTLGKVERFWQTLWRETEAPSRRSVAGGRCISRGSRRGCPNRECEHFGKLDKGNIVRHGYSKVKRGRRRRCRCTGCGRTFGATTGTHRGVAPLPDPPLCGSSARWDLCGGRLRKFSSEKVD